MEYLVRHRTTYRYLQDVSYSCHLAHLRLRDTPNQHVFTTAVSLDPEPASRDTRDDYFGNVCEWFTLDQPHALLEVLAESRVRVNPPPERDGRLSESWETVRGRLEEAGDAEARDAVQFIFDSPLTSFKSDIAAYAIAELSAGTEIVHGRDGPDEAHP